MSQPAVVINRSPRGSGVYALRQLLARVGIQARVDRYAVATALGSLLALGPMLHPGYFWGAHDARHSVYFLFEFDRVFRDGILYPRWFPDMTYGYGYPLFNIYGPLAFYVGEIFHLLGADLVLAVKLVFALAWVLSGLAMYGFVKRVFGSRPAALVAGLAYVYMPYHLVDVYVRAALAESVALVFLPLTLWAFYNCITQPTVRAVVIAAFCYAGMVFAHNGIALLFSLVLGAWIAFLVVRATRPLQIGWAWLVRLVRASLPTVGALALGLGLTGIFLLPLIAEYRYINVAQWTANYYNYQDHFVELYQLFSPLWGFGISSLGPVDGLSFQLGVVPVILALFSLFAVVKNPGGARPYILFFVAMTMVVIFFMLSWSLGLWQRLYLTNVAQFPWRLLTLTTVSLAAVAGAVLLDEGRGAPRSQNIAILALSALLVLGSYPYLSAQNILEPKEGPVGLAGLMAFESSANEMTGTTIYADEQPRWSPLADNYVAGRNVKSKIDYSTVPEWLFIRVTREGLRSNSERVDYHAPNGDVPIVFNIQMYPGWRAYLTRSRSTEILRELPIEIEPPYGRIKVTLPRGEYGLHLVFQDTPPRTVGALLSGVCLLLAGGLLVWDWRRNQKPKLP